MNIEGVNLSSLLSGNNTIEVAGVGAIPEDFSNTLMGQIEVLSEAIVQVESPGPLPNMTMPQAVNNGTDIDSLLKHKGNEQELVALFGKYLPVSNENDLNEESDLEASLLALTDSLTVVTPDNRTTGPVPMPAEVPAENMELIAAGSLTAVKPDNRTTGPVPMPTEVPAENMELIAAGSPIEVTPDKYVADSIPTTDEAVTTNDMSLLLADQLKAITPAIIFDDAAAMQNRKEVTALNESSFAKLLPEENKLNRLGEGDVVSGDFLQKETLLRQPIQHKQTFNLPYVENATSAEKALVFEKQAAISRIEQVAPVVASEITQFHRQLDNRVDSPAITRPLTHPDWSKDLGEQIVWMTNKVIPSVEIRLNPVHLGPISVRIDVDQDQATIMFTAQHMEVREAIEGSIPKLREMLGSQQLNLINVNISQNSHNSSSDQGRSQSQTFAKTSENRELGIENVTEDEHNRVAVSKGLLSIYA